MIRKARNHPLFLIGTEAAAVVTAYLAYSAMRLVVEGSYTRAIDHSFQLVSIEQTIGLFHEVSVQRAVDSQPWLAAFMEFFYLWAYLPLLIGSGLVMYARNRDLYRAYRTAMFASAAVGLIIFALVPVAPPRMLPEYGFFDSLNHSLAGSASAKNEFAAVPSFHFGFTLLAAVGVAHVFGFHRWLLAALALLPVIMLVSIVSTANHFFLDAVVGGAVVMVAWWLIVRPQMRRAPPTYEFEQQLAEAA